MTGPVTPAKHDLAFCRLISVESVQDKIGTCHAVGKAAKPVEGYLSFSQCRVPFLTM